MKVLAPLERGAAVSMMRFCVKRHACVLATVQEGIRAVHVRLRVKSAGGMIDVIAINYTVNVIQISAVVVGHVKFWTRQIDIEKKLP